MDVLVYGMNGLPLMPTTERKARILPKTEKAEIVCKIPFTIKLLYKQAAPLSVSKEVLAQKVSISGYQYAASMIRNRIQLNVEKENCIYAQAGIIEYMFTMFKNRNYIQGFEEGYARCQNKFIEETGVSLDEIKSMVNGKSTFIN